MQTKACSCSAEGWAEFINWKINHYLVPWRSQPAGFLTAESTGMTSWEHGVLAAVEPGARTAFSSGLKLVQLTGAGRGFSGGPGGACAARCAPAGVRSCASDQTKWRLQGAQMLGSVRAAADPVVLSFCLDWKREGPVFIKVGGSLLPNAGRQGFPT